jgi:hypothetical protein
MAHAVGRDVQRMGQGQRTRTVVLQQVKRHPLRRLHSDPRQAAQRLDQDVK